MSPAQVRLPPGFRDYRLHDRRGRAAVAVERVVACARSLRDRRTRGVALRSFAVSSPCRRQVRLRGDVFPLAAARKQTVDGRGSVQLAARTAGPAQDSVPSSESVPARASRTPPCGREVGRSSSVTGTISGPSPAATPPWWGARG